jgi:hypothetical protein
MNKIKFFSMIVVLCFVSACGAQPGPTAVNVDVVGTIVAATMEALPSPTVPAPTPTIQKTVYEFRARQFDPAAMFFRDIPYPPELTSTVDSNLIRLGCSHTYIRRPTKEYSYIDDDPATEAENMSDPLMQVFLDNARVFAQSRSSDPRTLISYIAYCDIKSENSIVMYGVGPCGGGCIGNEHISFGKPDGSLVFLADLVQKGGGGYAICSPLMLTMQRILYMKCPSEFGDMIKKVNLLDASMSIVLRCGIIIGKDESDITTTCGY